MNDPDREAVPKNDPVNEPLLLPVNDPENEPEPIPKSDPVADKPSIIADGFVKPAGRSGEPTAICDPWSPDDNPNGQSRPFLTINL